MTLSAPDLAKAILDSDDLRISKVTINEWKDSSGNPVTIGIRVMRVEERDAYEREWIGKREQGVENFRSKYLAKCLCHPETGERLFTDADVAALAKKSAAVVSRLFELATSHNAMTEADVETLAKN